MNSWTWMSSPLGELRLVAGGGVLRRVHMTDTRDLPAPAEYGDACDDEPVLQQARRELDEYFAGRRRRFEVALGPEGTEFQRAVWTALVAVDFGVLCSYGDIARAMGRPTATRAVGQANNRNPIPVIIPCHRIVGSDRSLTGYGGGLERKRWLLAHEARLVGAVFTGYDPPAC
ncbi:methylated-DNA--[protein]-cysteine S-methyltransferase [Nannocystis bainbridge]|uniref:Methylated-DNA--protein-cysteine methyltransferase n=1 Tax=Nannocystis bainbridge TaxID=2995303 RepID=A0ABT5EAA4_9BACT|nr:methylated-DNA--[protein]-cysteine S-methyltransferase [Nannocystis bainbridge]MDC0722383.1 methylated-DNA--[protein]-cysteine S-methyltransferase [Nannocystis bainbridge]